MSSYLTTEELASKIKYDVRTIRERLKDSVLLEGVHYFRPFGGRKILYVWDAIERDMLTSAPKTTPDGHPKLLHLWPVKLLQAGRVDYDDSQVVTMRAAASLRR